MKFSTILLHALGLVSAVQAVPTKTIAGDVTAAFAVAKRASSGSYTVSGLGTRKKAITAAGGTTLDMAIAMLETDTMKADYTYGDGKSQDSANFGIMKQNWGVLRQGSSQFKGQTTAQYNNGAVLNSNLAEDIKARHDCVAAFGIDKWFGGHRDGATGLTNYNTADINSYKNAVYWIQKQIEASSSCLTDDTRFWVDVTAI